MPPIPQLFEEYDIIFAGGGTTAGIIVGRLAAADPSLRMLILETGPHTKDDITIVQPGRFVSHLQPGSKTIRNVIGNPSEHLDGRRLPIQCGRCVGGGSSVNLAAYTRAPASDHDEWANSHNNPGWGWSDLLPLIKKAETYQNAPNRPTHGYSGPLKVSYGGARTNLGEDYLTTVPKYDRTRVVVDDANRMIDDVNRLEVWPKWIDKTNGRRSDVAHYHIYTALAASKNVHLQVGCSVKRVIIEDGRATGVEYVQISQGSSKADTRIARAKRLVVLSAGAFGSPTILERSGVGSKAVLEQHGIKQVVDLPGVGANYNDHPLILLPYRASDDAETLDAISRNDPDELEKWSKVWFKDGTGLLSTNGVDGGMKYRPSEKEVQAIGPDFTDRWTSFYADFPDKPIVWNALVSQYLGQAPPPAGQKSYCTAAYLAYPVGLGSVHITSADDPNSPPDFDTGVFSRKEDLAVMRHMYKVMREWARRMSKYRGEYPPGHPKFPEGSAAVIPETGALPVPIDAPDIVYTAEDDKAIDTLLKATVSTAWHSLGTCAMKPREKNGVVDPRLNVYDLEGLKVADMSVCPINLATNTYSTAVTIGEKAAMIIAEELGMKNLS